MMMIDVERQRVGQRHKRWFCARMTKFVSPALDTKLMHQHSIGSSAYRSDVSFFLYTARPSSDQPTKGLHEFELMAEFATSSPSSFAPTHQNHPSLTYLPGPYYSNV